MQTKVSTIIPAYNSAQYLPGAIESVLKQTHTNIEIIVVNDGSTDRTDDIIQPFLDKITYIKQVNKGLSAARNVGFRSSDGDFICFLDADDLLLPEKFEKQLNKFIQEPDLGVVISGYIAVDADGETEIQKVYKPWNRDALKRLLNHEVFPPHAALIRREALENSKLFPEDIDAGESQEDWQLWLDMALEGIQFSAVPEPLCKYRRNVNGSISSNLIKHMDGARRVVKWLQNDCRAAKHQVEINHLAAIVEMTRAGRAWRIQSYQTAIETFAASVLKFPIFWESPQSFRKLFEHTLDIEDAVQWSKCPDLSRFEITIVNGFISQLDEKINRKKLRDLSAVASLQLADFAYSSGENRLRQKALFQAVRYSLPACIRKSSLSVFIRAIAGPNLGQRLGKITRILRFSKPFFVIL